MNGKDVTVLYIPFWTVDVKLDNDTPVLHWTILWYTVFSDSFCVELPRDEKRTGETTSAVLFVVYVMNLHHYMTMGSIRSEP
jgi:hypothetical protein